MRIIIERVGGEIVVNTDYSEIESRGEISQTVIELEVIKRDLIDFYEDWDEKNDRIRK